MMRFSHLTWPKTGGTFFYLAGYRNRSMLWWIPLLSHCPPHSASRPLKVLEAPLLNPFFLMKAKVSSQQRRVPRQISLFPQRSKHTWPCSCKSLYPIQSYFSFQGPIWSPEWVRVVAWTLEHTGAIGTWGGDWAARELKPETERLEVGSEGMLTPLSFDSLL